MPMETLTANRLPLTAEQQRLVTDWLDAWDTPMRFVTNKLTRQYRAALAKGVEFEEIEAIALLGLVIAAQRYDRTKGTTFATWASWWFRWAINEALMTKVRQVSNPVGRTITSIDREWMNSEGDGDRNTILHWFGVTDPAHAIRDDRERRQQVREILNVLGPRHREVISMRFGIDHEQRSLQQIADLYGICKERVRQIETKAITKLRHHAAIRNFDGRLFLESAA